MTEQLEQDTEFRNVCEQIGGTAEGAYELSSNGARLRSPPQSSRWTRKKKP